MNGKKARSGGTLTEMMVAVAILSIGVLGMFGAFKYIGRSIFVSRTTSLATNLGQERIEYLKNLSYYALQVTTAAATDATVSPSILYDTVNYPPETISIGGITFVRYTYVTMGQLSGSDVANVASTYPDTGLKKIVVNIVWSEQGVRKKWSVTNLLENPNINPLDATISGTVRSSAGGTVASALVVCEQNEDWQATSNASGAYSFQVYHGTYTVRASSTGYTDAVSTTVVVAKGGTANADVTLIQVATGYLTGIAWMNTNLVISQVVASTVTAVADGTTQNVEYVELYNPTTFPIDVGTTGAGYNTIMMGYTDETGTIRYDSAFFGAANNLYITKITTYVAPGRYYLIGNATSFVIAGSWINVDAWWNGALGLPLTYANYILDDKAGSVFLYYDWQHGDPNPYIDLVGWADNNTGCVGGYYEGTCIPDYGGLNDGLGTPAGKQLVRVSSPGISAATLANYGRAYDSNSNARDFLYESAGFTGFVYPPKNFASGQFTTLTGKVPTTLGTLYVSASDSNSGSTQAWTSYVTSGTLSLPYSRFQLAAVSTGTWSVTASYNGYSAFVDTVTVTQNAYTPVPNGASSPAWPGSGLPHLQLTSTTASGFVKGVIYNNSAQPISGINIIGGGASKTTGSNGVYFMAVSSGVTTLIANPNNANAQYVQSIMTPTILQSQVTTQDFTLNFGGRITGYVTSGVTPIQYQPIAVTFGGSQVGAGVTDSSGYFSVRNVSTNSIAYTVFPVLETGIDVQPNTLPALLNSTGTIFVGTFTVNGAFGSITGTVSDASGLVTSGALILASTNSIASTPSAIVGSSAPAQVPMYMVSSKADGTYTLPVRGGATYYISAYVPVIATSGSVSVTTKTYSGIVVSPSVATTRNVTIP